MIKEKIAIFGGAFNPPGNHHIKIAQALSEVFDRVFIVPCGERADKPKVSSVSSSHRRVLAELAFAGLPKTEIDWRDLEQKIYTPTFFLQKRYEEKFPEAEIWHAVGEDLVLDKDGGSPEIRRFWVRGEEVWQRFNFAVLCFSGKIEKKDLPPRSMLINLPGLYGRSTLIRQCLKNGKAIDGLTTEKIITYIKKYKLYL